MAGATVLSWFAEYLETEKQSFGSCNWCACRVHWPFLWIMLSLEGGRKYNIGQRPQTLKLPLLL